MIRTFCLATPHRLLIAILALLATHSVMADLFIAQQFPPGLLHYNPTNGVLIGTTQKPDQYSETFDLMTSGPDGNLYVVDDYVGYARVLRFNGQSGAFMDIFVDDNTTNAIFSASGIAFGPDGNLYLCASRLNDNVRHFYRYSGQSGAYLGEFGSAAQGNLSNGIDLAFGQDGDLYVVDSAQGVLRYSGIDGHFKTLFVALGTNQPRALAFSPGGDLFLSSSNHVLRYSGTNGAFLGNFVTTSLSPILGKMVFGYDGLLYVCGTNAVLKFNATNGAYIDTFAMPPGPPANALPAGVALIPPPITNSWTSATGGNWEDLQWSLGIRPAINQSIVITNTGSKAVAIFPGTPVNYPSTMNISDLAIDAPSGYQNTLLLNFSGASSPLHVLGACTIGTNGILNNQYGGLIVDGMCQINGTVLQQGGLWTVPHTTTPMFGGTVSMNGDCLFRSFYALGGTLNQLGGTTTMTNLTLDYGNYNLSNGIFQGAIVITHGTFSQYAGTNYLSGIQGLDFGSGGSGVYNLNGGTIYGSLQIGSEGGAYGVFNQSGGVANAPAVVLGTYNSFGGQYHLTNGTLNAGYVSLLNGSFNQLGGVCLISNGLSLSGYDDGYTVHVTSFYQLTDGFLSCASLGISVFAGFTQNGGTNVVTNTLSLDRSPYTLSSGVLISSNTVLRPPAYTVDGFYDSGAFTQSGGTHQVLTVLENNGNYLLNGGLLVARDIVLRGTLSIGSGLPAPVITNTGSFQLAGILNLGAATQQLGSLGLSSNAVINFGSNNCILKFTDSSSQIWTNNATLTITNWNGLTSGGGTDRLIVGSSSAGLTAAQLRQIRFVNPGGFAPGTLNARILNTGEVVPTFQPTISSLRNGTNLVLNWTGNFTLQTATNAQGPYLDVPNAASPYTNSVNSTPRRFYRLRQ
ncbi:MAG: repeat containing protein [Pedosphaera sp.]|nr:repeat containing protein [Pedosphaera sp.]